MCINAKMNNLSGLFQETEKDEHRKVDGCSPVSLVHSFIGKINEQILLVSV